MSGTAAPADEKDKRLSTREKLEAARNMSPKEVASYLVSPEFAKHGSRAVASNARRLNALLTGSTKQYSLEDTALMRDAVSVIDRAKYASGHELPDAVVKAKAYGYDVENGESDEKGGGVEMASEKPLETVPDGSIGDDDAGGSDGTGDEE